MLKKIKCPNCEKDIDLTISYNISDSLQFARQCPHCRQHYHFFTPIEINIEVFKSQTDLSDRMKDYHTNLKEERYNERY